MTPETNAQLSPCPPPSPPADAVGGNSSNTCRQRISRALLTDILQYTPQIPSICCAAAHPHLRYARETVAGTRADHAAHHRGDLYVCWDAAVSREYHSFSGEEGELAPDLQMMAWWLTRSFLSNGEPMILEVNVKKQAPTFGASAAGTGLESILRLLTSPPYQQVDAGTSCLRSLIFTPNRLEVTPAVLGLMGRLTHLEKFECFSQSLTLPLPEIPSAYVAKLRNLKSLTSVRPLLPLSNLRRLSLCRCSELHSVAALAELPELVEVRLANCRQLDLRGDYTRCRHLTSFSMRWCKEVLHSGDLATLPNLRELDCSYCGLCDVEGLARCTRLRRLSLRGCQTIHELFPVRDDTTEGSEATDATPLLSSFSLSVDAEALSMQPLSSRGGSQWFTRRSSPAVTSAVMVPRLCQLEELDAGESSLATLTGVAQCAPELRHLTVRECKHLHSLSPLGHLPTLTSVDASFSGVNELQGLAESFSLEYVNLKNCTELRSVASLAKVGSLREVDLSELGMNCIICIDDDLPEESCVERSAAAAVVARRRRSELSVLSPSLRSVAVDDTQIGTAVTQRSTFGASQHHVRRRDAEALLSQPLNELRNSEADAIATTITATTATAAW
jgi:hypothetical protein